ncbi:NFX1-type zinc finger-containing protein 1 [Caerostris extrusa]|uniref:NFX1-type zinc finger-containing protein 1 n=1 Tax=Caerostris extrusa TaxID=172846 RepID=A0AAV4QBB2_CAEEX|nr:NFX1-type zinc finger-containing protein 1 [Caerostris extrusa]
MGTLVTSRIDRNQMIWTTRKKTSDFAEDRRFHPGIRGVVSETISKKNYRTIPILPNELDIQQSFAFLRPSVIKGRYQNTEHYLDVQYRLLREDYVRPLRDGITEYLVFKKQNKSTKRIKDARVYPEVKLLKQEFVNGELLHMAFFNDKNSPRLSGNSASAY